MCIQTRIERAIAEKAALDIQIQKLESLETKTTPVKTLLSELLADYAAEAPEELAAIWQEVLAIGQQFDLSVQPLAADELKAWEAANATIERLRQEDQETKRQYLELTEVSANRIKELQAELERTKMAAEVWQQQLEEVQSEITEQDRAWGEVSDERDDLEKEVAELRSQMPTPTIRAEYELVTGNDASELSEAQCQQQLEVWEKETQAPVITEEEAHELETIPAAKESILESNGFFQCDADMPPDWDASELYENYRGWDIFYSVPNGGIVAIGLNNSESNQFWDASTEGIQEIEGNGNTFPESLGDYDEIVAWTKQLIDQVVAATPTPVESSEVPGQLALEFPSLETEHEAVLTGGEYNAVVEEELALDDEIPELGGNWEKVIENYDNAKPTELQKVLFENDSSFVFEPAETGNNVQTFVSIHSQITSADDTVDFATEEARFDVGIFEGGFQGDYEKAEYFLDAQTFLYHHRADIRQAALGYAKYFWQELEKKAEIKEKVAHWNADKTLPPNQPASEPIAESANTEPAQLETVAEAPTQESKFKVGDRLRWDDPEDENDTSRSQGLAGSINRITKLGNICWTPDGSTIERILPLPMAERVLSPIGSVESELPKSETDTEFEAMGLHVIVYPSYGNGELVGATFRFLNPEEMGADGKPKIVFFTSLLVAEMGELSYKVVAEQLIMNHQAKKAARLEKLANPHATEEDKFIELVKLTPAVGYIKRRDNGELISAYAAFANRDAAGEKTETLAKPRAKKWKEFWHSSFESCGWKVEEPRKVKRMQSEPGAKQVFAYEVKITGKFSIGQLQKLAEEDFSLLPNEIVAKSVPVDPVATAAAPNFKVIVNGFEMASGKNDEVLSRFEEKLAEIGSTGTTSVSLMRGSEVVERYAVADFNFIEAQDFDAENPEYWVLHQPTQINFRVYRSFASGGDWINSIYPYRPNLFTTKEAAAVDAVRRQLKAEKTE